MKVAPQRLTVECLRCFVEYLVNSQPTCQSLYLISLNFKSNKKSNLFPSIHFFSIIFLIGSWEQQPEQRCHFFPVHIHFIQLLWGSSSTDSSQREGALAPHPISKASPNLQVSSHAPSLTCEHDPERLKLLHLRQGHPTDHFFLAENHDLRL